MPQKLGQHFLTNAGAIQKIIAALDIQPGETIVEIGPGRGALTLPLAEACKKTDCRILAIEKDSQLVTWLISYLVNWKNTLEIKQGDVLKLLPQLSKQPTKSLSNYKVVGNIPYYITGNLLRILSELDTKPSKIVLTIQKEVAERITARPPKMNLLAAITQFWSEPKILARLKAGDFSPPPKVDSAIIQLLPKTPASRQDQYFAFVKRLFKQPRKTLLNNLAAKGEKKLVLAARLKKYGLGGNERPQNLDIPTLIALSQSTSDV